MYYHELKALLKWLGKMQVRTMAQLKKLQAEYGLDSTRKLLNFANWAMTNGYTVSELI